MIPEGSTHALKHEFSRGPFNEFVKIVDGTAYSYNDISGNWMPDKNIVNYMHFYNEIVDLTETPEEKEIFDNWPSERRIDIIASNGNTGEHYAYCDKVD